MRGLTETKESGICECCSDRQKERIGFFAVAKTYNSGDSLVVTHLTTNPPVSCLSKAERTGSPAFTHASAQKALNSPVCGDLNGVAPFLDVGC
jgi:hypothetical protein